MKKVLALVIAVLMIAAMTNLALAFDVPPEITASGAGPAGSGVESLWPLEAGNHDPSLDSEGIPDGAHVFIVMDPAASAPTTIAGYTKVDSVKDIKPGTFATPTINNYPYIIILEGVAAPETPEEPEEPEEVEEPVEVTPEVPDAPVEVSPDPQPAEPPAVVEEPPVVEAPPAPEAPAAAYSKPAEIASAFDVGVWPMAANTYDPGLDGQGIKNGVYVYGLFDAAYAPVAAPTALAGYTAAASAESMTPGSFYVLNASSGFGYVLVSPAAGSAPATGDTSGIVIFSAMFAVAALGFALALPRRGKSRSK